MTEFLSRLEQIIRTPVLLVASDYDGVVAPIVPSPDAAFPIRESVVAMRSLAETAQTHAAVISGRSLADLLVFLPDPGGVHLVGSHGSEFDPGFASQLTPQARRLREEVERELRTLAELDPGFLVETKPASVAFHYRNADEDAAERAVASVRQGIGARPGVHMKDGKKVVELMVVAADKGMALERLRRRVGATAVVYLGDDVTDEDAFKTLSGPDLSIKVGPGSTCASMRVDSPEEAARVLAFLAEGRDVHAGGEETTAIESHTMLSDCRTLALLDDRASIVWYCIPRADSGAIFARLVGGHSAGYFEIVPENDEGSPLECAYVDDSMTAVTRSGSTAITDYLDMSHYEVESAEACPVLVRSVRSSVPVRIEFAPKLNYGRTRTMLEIHSDTIRILGTAEPIELHAPGITWELIEHGEDQAAVGRFVPRRDDDEARLELRYGLRGGSGGTDESRTPTDSLEETTDFWRTWAASLRIPPLHEASVRRSAIVLRSLCYDPTGAILAAATTSLPETLGGVRNWDYRYCWPRDGAVAAAALVALGSVREAQRLLDWMCTIHAHVGSLAHMRPLYTVDGQEVPQEAELAGLAGYAGSRPVRLGNGASEQLQLDVFGPVAELAFEVQSEAGSLHDTHLELVRHMAEAVMLRWEEPDHGIWEVRAELRHYVHSKVMCWVTLDRAVRIFQRADREVSPGWLSSRDRIRSQVLECGYDASLGAFTAAYGVPDLDAAVLHVGLSGLIDADDARWRSTVEVIQDALCENGTVYRYKFDDGLPGREGGFHLCTSWLIDSLIMLGDSDRAEALFQGVIESAGATGLLPEQVDAAGGGGLGNVPQAYSHAGLIQNAVRLARGKRNLSQ